MDELPILLLLTSADFHFRPNQEFNVICEMIHAKLLESCEFLIFCYILHFYTILVILTSVLPICRYQNNLYILKSITFCYKRLLKLPLTINVRSAKRLDKLAQIDEQLLKRSQLVSLQ